MTVPGTRRRVLAPLLLIGVLALFLPGLFAAAALGAEGDMQGMEGMEGMSAEEMQNMTTPTPAPSATAMSGDDAHSAMPATSAADGHGSAAATDAHAGTGGGSVNWLVIGGFMALIAGSTIAAVAMKRHLRRRMLAGELAGAGVQSD